QTSLSGMVVLIASVMASFLTGYAQERRQVNVIVDAEPVSSKFKASGPFMFRVSIYNGLKEEIRFSTFALEPNGWNGETANLTFFDVNQKSGKHLMIGWRRPEINVPLGVAGMASYRIKPKEKLYILVDAKKGYAEVEWFSGEYEMLVRADHIVVDKYTTISVASKPIKFTVG
ncbi:MAG: hypothetical protein LC785_08980, partial [Acidobacteria bacterium]|nr:hypothetical protein [Acidobacteriota bacterium]MCA1642068.1 hypothetical protein [Acidobacteriota bacterium]